MAYCVWCNDSGHLLDDGTVFRLGEGEYRLCTAERQIDWLLDSAIGFDVEIGEVTEQIAALALQGPTSCAVLKALGLSGIDRLKPFEIGYFSLRGRQTHRVAHRFHRRSGIRVVDGAGGGGGHLGRVDGGGALARHSCHRLAGAQHGAHRGRIHPAACGFRFRGTDDPYRPRPLAARARARLARRFRERALHTAAAHCSPNGREGRAGNWSDWMWSATSRPTMRCSIWANGSRQIGAVTSATWSPTCKRNIALAMVDAPYFQIGTTVWADIYLNRELVWERRMSKAQVVERPFFAPERRRVTPPGEF